MLAYPGLPALAAVVRQGRFERFARDPDHQPWKQA